MRFHLNYTPEKFDFEIDHRQKIMLWGSCFSENIGNLLELHKFQTCSNPNGILFNPKSIYTGLYNVLKLVNFNEQNIIKRDGLFYSYLHHSSVSNFEKENLIERINSENKKANLFLQESDYLVITFGTAFYYDHLALGKTVANCHKQLASTFEKKILSPGTIISDYTELIKKLQAVNSKLKIIFTVSPVKHLKDGMIENNLSKATLILSVHELIKGNTGCYYFPAYELVNDDLRDYRFYKEDLAHPNEAAINYVWEKFSEACFGEKTILLNKLIQKLHLAQDHRKMNAGSGEQQKLKDFIAKQKDEIKKLDPTIEF